MMVHSVCSVRGCRLSRVRPDSALGELSPPTPRRPCTPIPAASGSRQPTSGAWTSAWPTAASSLARWSTRQGLPMPRNHGRQCAAVTGQAATANTDSDGRFQIRGLSGGLYEVTAAQRSGAFRLWAGDASPPGAVKQVLLVAGQQVTRGQYCQRRPIVRRHRLAAWRARSFSDRLAASSPAASSPACNSLRS